MLRDLTIQNYRCFKDFHIDGLARVNLIVGANNIGKTSFLEAVYLLVNQVNIQSLINLLHNRGEIADYSISPLPGEIARRASGYQIKHIFYERQLNPDRNILLQSEKDHSLWLEIQIKQPENFEKPPGFSWDLFLTPEGVGSDPYKLLLLLSGTGNTEMPIPIRDDGLITDGAFQQWKKYKPNIYLTTSNPRLFLQNNNHSLFLTTSNLNFEQMAGFWDSITLTPKEESVVTGLQILDPDVERISFTSRQTANSGILLKIRGKSEPIPLGSMGEGMRRILALAMAIVTVENGFLLVDEIETGLYYETQTDMWRLILETAQRLNVQVFATTHSWDCIAAFQEALSQLDDSSVGKLFRLSRRDEDICAVEYTPDELSIAVRQSIEVR